MGDDSQDARRALQKIEAHEVLCAERWQQLRDGLRDHRAEFKEFRAWLFSGLVVVLLTMVGAFAWMVAERALAPPAHLEQHQ